MIGANRALAVTLYYLGDFEAGQQYAMRGVEIWRGGGVRAAVGEISTAEAICLVYAAITGWHLGEIAFGQSAMAEAISLAKELNDMHGLAVALWNAGTLAHFEGDPAEVERLASDLIQLSTRQNFAQFLAGGEVLRGWARSAFGDRADAVSWIESGIRDWLATGSMWSVPYFLALKAEALHLADRSDEALVAITEAEAVAQRTEERCWSAELHRLRGVFLATLGAEETEIEGSFCEAIRIANEQKSVSLGKRAEGTYAEYRRQKARASGGLGFRLPLW
jgi:predicted ATPase